MRRHFANCRLNQLTIFVLLHIELRCLVGPIRRVSPIDDRIKRNERRAFSKESIECNVPRYHEQPRRQRKAVSFLRRHALQSTIGAYERVLNHLFRILGIVDYAERKHR